MAAALLTKGQIRRAVVGKVIKGRELVKFPSASETLPAVPPQVANATISSDGHTSSDLVIVPVRRRMAPIHVFRGNI